MGDRQRTGTALPAIDILVEAGAWASRAKLKQLASGCIAAAVARVSPRFAPGSEMSIVFTDDAQVRVLNHQFRQMDKPTNVLSFPASTTPGIFGPLVGDIIIAQETVAREAEEGGITFDDHLSHLIVHGFLHLLGHDHIEDDEAEVMESLETEILAGLGIADPYADLPAEAEPASPITQQKKGPTAR